MSDFALIPCDPGEVLLRLKLPNGAVIEWFIELQSYDTFAVIREVPPVEEVYFYDSESLVRAIELAGAKS